MSVNATRTKGAIVTRIGRIEFIARSRAFRVAAQAIVDACPAEEDPLDHQDCFHMMIKLVGNENWFFQFAVFELLYDRFHQSTT